MWSPRDRFQRISPQELIAVIIPATAWWWISSCWACEHTKIVAQSRLNRNESYLQKHFYGYNKWIELSFMYSMKNHEEVDRTDGRRWKKADAHWVGVSALDLSCKVSWTFWWGDMETDVFRLCCCVIFFVRDSERSVVLRYVEIPSQN